MDQKNKASTQKEKLTSQLITNILFKAPRPLTHVEIIEQCQDYDASGLSKILEGLIDEYLVIEVRGRYELLAKTESFVGRILIKEKGYGFVTPVSEVTELMGNVKTVFVKDTRNAITNDLVLVRIVSQKILASGIGFEGEIRKIVERGNPYFFGSVKQSNKTYYIKPIGMEQDVIVLLNTKNEEQDKVFFRKNQFVKVLTEKYGERGLCYGKVVEVLGDEKDPGIDVDVLVSASQVHQVFPEDCLAQAQRLQKLISESGDLLEVPSDRVDFTNRVVFTVDNEKARDFDDAVSIDKLANGNWLLGVYIADVSHYVTMNSPIDLEAIDREFSVYLPDRVIPMLPEVLSNELCSLKPNVKRLVVAIDMEIDQKGEIVEYSITEGVIRSSSRLTYHGINEFLNGKELDTDQRILEKIPVMVELSHILNKKRIREGALELDSPEIDIVLDDNGKVVELKTEIRGESEKLIEEFMLVSNFTVASAFQWLDQPFIYRIHETPKPEKITQFKSLIMTMGYNLNTKKGEVKSTQLQQLLNRVEIPEHRYLMNILLLRSQAKAKYSETNLGHFGLASECYAHFTSPIRRYPDLLVHRLIKKYLLQTSTDTLSEELTRRIALLSSKQERVIEKLERDVVDLKKCQYISDKIGESFLGTVSGVTPKGVYVEMDNHVEGFIDISSKYYNFVYQEYNLSWSSRKANILLQLGTKVKVSVESVNITKREVNLSLEECYESNTVQKNKNYRKQ